MSQLDVGAAERVDLLTDAGPLAALQTGPADGAPVLLVPGFTGSKEDFGPVLDAIAAAGLRATSIDLPGQFESPGPADPDAYAPDRLAGAVLAAARLLDPAGRGVRLVGHSFGGLVCRAAVSASPDAFGTLVLMGSGPGRVGRERTELLELMLPLLDGLGVTGIYEASQDLERAEPGYVEPAPELAAFFRRRFVAGSAAMLRGMAEALLGEPDRVDELAATGVPVLVMHGVDDVPWPVEQQRAMAQRLGARYVVIDPAEHSPAVENPSATAAALLDFWRS